MTVFDDVSPGGSQGSPGWWGMCRRRNLQPSPPARSHAAPEDQRKKRSLKASHRSLAPSIVQQTPVNLPVEAGLPRRSWPRRWRSPARRRRRQRLWRKEVPCSGRFRTSGSAHWSSWSRSGLFSWWLEENKDERFLDEKLVFLFTFHTFLRKTQKRKPQTGTETNFRNNFYFSPPSLEIFAQSGPTFHITSESVLADAAPPLAAMLEVTSRGRTADCVEKTDVMRSKKWEKHKEEHLFPSGWSCPMFPVVLRHRHSTPPFPAVFNQKEK